MQGKKLPCLLQVLLRHTAESMWESKTTVTPNATFTDSMTSLSGGGHPQDEDENSLGFQQWMRV